MIDLHTDKLADISNVLSIIRTAGHAVADDRLADARTLLARASAELAELDKKLGAECRQACNLGG